MRRLALASMIALLGCGDDGGGTSTGGSESADESGGSTSASTTTSSSASGSASGSSGESSETGSSGSAEGSSGSAEAGSSSGSGESGGGGTFPCGPELECLVDTQYCESHMMPVNPDTYACIDAPRGCPQPPTCECLAGASACGNCEMLPGGGIMTSCLKP